MTGMSGEIIQRAVPSNRTPKKFFTACIQAPALGNSAPAEAPMTSRGNPMPKPIMNRAAPPSKTSRDWLTYKSAPAKGAATHGPTMTADIAPMAKTPASVPPVRRLLVLVAPDCHAVGNCNS